MTVYLGITITNGEQKLGNLFTCNFKGDLISSSSGIPLGDAEAYCTNNNFMRLTEVPDEIKVSVYGTNGIPHSFYRAPFPQKRSNTKEIEKHYNDIVDDIETFAVDLQIKLSENK